jgi:hypothetical protein
MWFCARRVQASLVCARLFHPQRLLGTALTRCSGDPHG